LAEIWERLRDATTCGYKYPGARVSPSWWSKPSTESPVQDMWLTVASIVLVAAIGFVVLSLAVQWWDLTREPDNGD